MANSKKPVVTQINLVLTHAPEKFVMTHGELHDEIVSWLSDLGYEVTITSIKDVNNEGGHHGT